MSWIGKYALRLLLSMVSVPGRSDSFICIGTDLPFWPGPADTPDARLRGTKA